MGSPAKRHENGSSSTRGKNVFSLRLQNAGFAVTGSFPLLFPQIDPVPQHAGTFECNDFSRGEDDGIARLRIPTAALVLVFDAELAETAYQDIFTVFQGLLDDLEKSFDDLSGFSLREDVLGKKILNDVGLRQSHIAVLSPFHELNHMQ
jgi:hypothetical protein